MAKIIQNIDETRLCRHPLICHGGWVPISAKIVKSKNVTGYIAIKDDLENAGAVFTDQEVVVDQNLISSRTPADLPHFCKAILRHANP